MTGKPQSTLATRSRRAPRRRRSRRRPARSSSRPPRAPPPRWPWATRSPWRCSTRAASSSEDFAHAPSGRRARPQAPRARVRHHAQGRAAAEEPPRRRCCPQAILEMTAKGIGMTAIVDARRQAARASSPTATCAACSRSTTASAALRVGDVMTTQPHDASRPRSSRPKPRACCEEQPDGRAPRRGRSPRAASWARSPSTTSSPRAWSRWPASASARAACGSRSSTSTACSPTARSTSGPQGEALKAFNILDGHGVKMLQAAGVATAILSGRTLAQRSRGAPRELGIAHVIQGATDKLARLSSALLASAQASTAPQCAFVGDDLPDLAVMRRCGLAVAVANAVEAVKSRGALRDACVAAGAARCASSASWCSRRRRQLGRASGLSIDVAHLLAAARRARRSSWGSRCG